MRMAFGMLVAAGCGASPTYGPSISCGTPVSAFCPGPDCPDLDQELHTGGTCCLNAIDGYYQCGDWTIIECGDNVATHLFFKNGAFYARIDWPGANCIFGPASFAVPECPGEPMPLPACQ